MVAETSRNSKAFSQRQRDKICMFSSMLYACGGLISENSGGREKIWRERKVRLAALWNPHSEMNVSYWYQRITRPTSRIAGLSRCERPSMKSTAFNDITVWPVDIDGCVHVRGRGFHGLTCVTIYSIYAWLVSEWIIFSFS